MAMAPQPRPIQRPSLLSPIHAFTFPLTPNTPHHHPLPPREFPNLIVSTIFHPLPAHDLPIPFRTNASQASPDTSLATLLSTGHFRAAAIHCANALPKLHPSAHQQIFYLWFIRLSCLCLINELNIAMQEVKSLEDLSGPAYWYELPPRAAHKNQPPSPAPRRRHLVPWELRLLALRLQALSFNDWRRAMVTYYDLARESRGELAMATLAMHAASGDGDVVRVERYATEVGLWRARLKDLAVRIASALIEMGDLGAAMRHLEGLVYDGVEEDGGNDKNTMESEEDREERDRLRYMLALLYIRIGNYTAARGVLPPPPPESTAAPTNDTALLTALTLLAEARFPEAAEAWTHLVSLSSSSASSSSHTSDPLTSPPLPLQTEQSKSNLTTPLARLNLAVSLVYTGRLALARDILEDLIEEGHAFYALTFNLATVYELCAGGDRTRELKEEMIERVAARSGRVELGPAAFKLS